MIANRHRSERRGIVLLAVLIVVVLLSLAAYQFSDMTSQEYQLTHKLTRSAQARALAASGVHYSAAMLSNPNAYSQVLMGNPFSNQAAFDGSQMQPDSFQGVKGWFRIVAPFNPEDMSNNQQPPYNFGVTDESGKININALMQLDSNGDTCYNVLLQLPNMTTELAESIVDWMAPSGSRPNQAAESSYYASLPQPYQCKFGPVDTMDELLSIHNMTPALLYGDNVNRSGIPSSSQPGNGTFNPGLAAYITVYSTEPNVNSAGSPRININMPLTSQTDVTTLQSNIQQAFTAAGVDGQAIANFIVAARLHGGIVALPTTTSARRPASNGAQTTIPSNQLTFGTNGQQTSNITSLYQLINGQVNATTGSTNTIMLGNLRLTTMTMVSYPSPLNDSTTLQSLAPVIFDQLTTTSNAYVPARVNIDTAPLAVLQAIPYMWQPGSPNGTTWVSSTSSSSGSSTTGGTTTPATTTTPRAGGTGGTTNNYTEYNQLPQQIYQARQAFMQMQQPPAIYTTPLWMLSQQQQTFSPAVTSAMLQKLEPYITATTSVYRVQSIGEYENGGPYARIEAVIQVLAQRPRFLLYHELTDLGKGIDD
jgi:hypothetical protein